MACDVPKPCKFPSFDSGQKRFLWTHKEVDLAQQQVVGRVLKVGEKGESFLKHLVSRVWILVSESASRVHVSQL